MRWMILPFVLWSGIAVAAPRVRAVRGGPDLSRILWIGAHPDDEILVAPLLGRACVDGTSACSLLVITRGENGVCGLPGGCSPDLGTVRAMEMQSAAALLHATLTQWSLPDVMANVEASWPGVVDTIAAVIASERPSIVITFDPHHGSSCHPAHVATGALVQQAIARTADRPPVYFLETFYTVDSGGFVFRNAVTTSRAMTTYDAAAAWHFFTDDVRAHASQFTAPQADALGQLPDDQKRVYVMPAGASAEAQYNAVCP